MLWSRPGGGGGGGRSGKLSRDSGAELRRRGRTSQTSGRVALYVPSAGTNKTLAGRPLIAGRIIHLDRAWPAAGRMGGEAGGGGGSASAIIYGRMPRKLPPGLGWVQQYVPRWGGGEGCASAKRPRTDEPTRSTRVNVCRHLSHLLQSREGSRGLTQGTSDGSGAPAESAESLPGCNEKKKKENQSHAEGLGSVPVTELATSTGQRLRAFAKTARVRIAI